MLVASLNDIHCSEKLRYHFWSRSECGTVECVLQKPASTVKISANSLTTHIKSKRFRSSFQFCWQEHPFLKKNSLYSRVLADFYKFHLTFKVLNMQPLPWEIGSLGCRFLGFILSKQLH